MDSRKPNDWRPLSSVSPLNFINDYLIRNCLIYIKYGIYKLIKYSFLLTIFFLELTFPIEKAKINYYYKYISQKPRACTMFTGSVNRKLSGQSSITANVLLKVWQTIVFFCFWHIFLKYWNSCKILYTKIWNTWYQVSRDIFFLSHVNDKIYTILQANMSKS